MSFRISSFKKVMAVVAVLLILPSILASFQNPVCEPPYCDNACSEGHYDCTYDWMMSSPSNFALAMYLMMQGYTVLVCCSN